MNKSTHKKIDAKARMRSAEIKQQIVDRVKPAPRQPNVVKKRYLPGSPGAARAKLGVTLTQVKKGMNEPRIAHIDEKGVPFFERDAHACTLRRRSYTRRGLLGYTKFMRRPELKAVAVARKQCRKSKAYGTAPVAASAKKRA